MPTSRTRISYYKKSETKGALVRGCPPSDACPRPAGRRCASYEDGIAPDVVVTLFQSSGEHRVDGTALEFRHLSLIRTRSRSSAPNCNSTHINVPRIDRNGVGPALGPEESTPLVHRQALGPMRLNGLTSTERPSESADSRIAVDGYLPCVRDRNCRARHASVRGYQPCSVAEVEGEVASRRDRGSDLVRAVSSRYLRVVEGSRGGGARCAGPLDRAERTQRDGAGDNHRGRCCH